MARCRCPPSLAWPRPRRRSRPRCSRRSSARRRRRTRWPTPPSAPRPSSASSTSSSRLWWRADRPRHHDWSFQMATALTLPRRRRLRIRAADLFGYALVLPAMLCVLGFVFYPVVSVVRLSFTNTSLLTHRSDFVGFDSYARILGDPLIGLVLKNTAVWVFVGTTMVIL